MAGISPKLPLSISKEEITYVSNKNLKESIHQNVKNLILTNPGEKVFDAKFGAGVRSFLFENADRNTSSRIENAITAQINEYVPFVKIESLEANIVPDENKLYLTFSYSVPTLSLANTLSLEITRN